MKKIISFCLLTVIVCTTLILSSCNIGVGDMGHKTHDLFPEGYTGGFRHQPGPNIEYWWVETYEECLEAIELLKSHGSTFSDDLHFVYESELVDCKYCFVITGVGGKSEEIKWGDNPFDRCAKDVRIDSYAFFGEVTIDEINHSLVSNFNAYKIGGKSVLKNIIDNHLESKVVIDEWTNDYPRYYKRAYYEKQVVMHIDPCFVEGTQELIMTDECIEELICSAKSIELNSKS